MMMSRYLIVIESARDNYSAYCPDLPGVIATGQTPEKTAEMMREAIEFHLEGMKAEGLHIPEPTTTAVSVDVEV